MFYCTQPTLNKVLPYLLTESGGKAVREDLDLAHCTRAQQNLPTYAATALQKTNAELWRLPLIWQQSP